MKTSRRSFLKQAAVAVGVGAVAGCATEGRTPFSRRSARVRTTWRSAVPRRTRCTDPRASCGCVVYCEGAVIHHDRFGGIKVYDLAGKKLIREWTVSGIDPAEKKLGVNDSAGGGSTTIAHAGKFAECVRNHDLKTASTIDDAVKSDLLTAAGNVSLLAGEAVKIDPQTGLLADPNCASAKFWNRTYEPGWEPKA